MVVLHFLNPLLGFLLVTSHVLVHPPCTVSQSSRPFLEVGVLAQTLYALETLIGIDKCSSKKITANLLPQQEPGEVNCMEWHGWNNILRDYSVIHLTNIYWELLAYYLVVIVFDPEDNQ